VPDLQLFNTLTRKKEVFVPLQGPRVTLYTCGPTVYHYAHIGNLRTFIFDDLLERVLLANNYTVDRVMNITDVGHLTSDADEGEDKMEKGSLREGTSVWDIAKRYTEYFLEDLTRLGCKIPAKLPRATEFIAPMITLVKELEDKGLTYATSDGIYFDTAKFPTYTALAKLDLEGLQEGARVEVNSEKKHPSDFALWKLSSADTTRQMEWESPWGIGFPGWHLECSAMAMDLLGKTIDIHTGGVDHISVHHTNEIAQSEGVTGKKFANYWMHGEFLVLGNEEKMAKSGDNFLTLQTLIDKGIDPLSYRFFCLMTHYRSKLTFSWDALQAAQTGLQNLKAKIAVLQDFATKKGIVSNEHHDAFFAGINDDLNTPRALDNLQRMIKDDILSPEDKLACIAQWDTILGLQLLHREEKEHFIFDVGIPVISDVDLHLPRYSGVLEKLQQRCQARIEKRWADSDIVRDEITNLFGLSIKDGKEEWVVTSI